MPELNPFRPNDATIAPGAQRHVGAQHGFKVPANPRGPRRKRMPDDELPRGYKQCTAWNSPIKQLLEPSEKLADLAFNYGLSLDTLMKYQRGGAPKRWSKPSEIILQAMVEHYKKLIADRRLVDAGEFLELCKRDGWNLEATKSEIFLHMVPEEFVRRT
jgi:hypothetical protein